MNEYYHSVTIEDLRRFAAVDQRSLFRDCASLIDCEGGIIAVRSHVVSGTLDGKTRYEWFPLLYSRETFIEDGIIIGKAPRTIGGSDLDAKLAEIAAGLNETEIQQ